MFSTNDLFTIILNLAFSAGSSGFQVSGSGGGPVDPPT
ncbi:hypothetical protein C8K36_107115 [Rhodococcus sp. OK519]|nr:hypothetical protein C8K36_107115 [Rhodococcus sp. OK519]